MQICVLVWLPLFRSLCSPRLRIEVAGNTPVPSVNINHYRKTTCEITNGGGGNCTRVPDSKGTFRKYGSDMTPGGWSEIGRGDEAIGEFGRKLAPSDASGQRRDHGAGAAR